MISGTITDASGRTLLGSNNGSILGICPTCKSHCCGPELCFGADLLRPYIQILSRVADVAISAYPNAGLPNELSEYDDGPNLMAEHMAEWANSGLLNIVGGCCGTSPDHIRAIAEAVEGIRTAGPRRPFSVDAVVGARGHQHWRGCTTVREHW